jgi:hypothetical protein
MATTPICCLLTGIPLPLLMSFQYPWIRPTLGGLASIPALRSAFRHFPSLLTSHCWGTSHSTSAFWLCTWSFLCLGNPPVYSTLLSGRTRLLYISLIVKPPIFRTAEHTRVTHKHLTQISCYMKGNREKRWGNQQIELGKFTFYVRKDKIRYLPYTE